MIGLYCIYRSATWTACPTLLVSDSMIARGKLLALTLLALSLALAARIGVHKAAASGELGPLKAALAKKRDDYNDAWVYPDVNKPDARGDPPLMLAVCNKRLEPEAAKLVLEKGADPNGRDKRGWTALHHLADACFSVIGEMANEFEKRLAKRLAKQLLEAGADIGATNKALSTPLHLAATSGRAKLVSMLLYYGAPVDALDEEGMTALHLAADRRHARAVLQLLKAGADPFIRDKEGMLPSDYVSIEEDSHREPARDSFSAKIRMYLTEVHRIRAEAAAEKEEKEKAKEEKAKREVVKADL